MSKRDSNEGGDSSAQAQFVTENGREKNGGGRGKGGQQVHAGVQVTATVFWGKKKN